METATLKPLDLVVILFFLSVCIGIGVYCSRRNKSADSYFLAGRKMPGWVVGFSLMATLISSMTFLASPGFAYVKDWRYLSGSILFIIAIIFGIKIFMPVFRISNISSSYEYLERRFGRWARIYASLGYILMQIARLGLVLYTVSLAIHLMLGTTGRVITVEWVIIILGVAVGIYTIAGGLEAVMWTDLFNGIALMIGGLICLPIIIMKLPGGLGQLLSVAYHDGKMLPKELFEFSFTKETIWMMFLPAFFNPVWCTEQTTVQRYIAPKSEKEAKKAMIFSFFMVVPVWIYFAFIGTAMYVFYKVYPDPAMEIIVKEPERILPFFILTQVPAGLAGFVIAGLIAAATSSLDSSINACASTLTTDFYKTIIMPNRSQKHYFTLGRWASVFFTIIMIVLALIIHWLRSQTIQDLQQIISQILTSGLFALFMLGLITKRIGNKAALWSTIITVLFACSWLYLDTAHGRSTFPTIAQYIPVKFWFGVLCNILLFTTAYILSIMFKLKNFKDITNLSIWTCRKYDES